MGNRKFHILPLLLVLAIVLYACANIGTPDGGPYDETPPRIVHTSPKFGAVGSKATKIVLEFDENIKLERASEKVVISPPQINQPEIDASGKRITVALQDSLKPNTTYTIDFSDAIQDNNEGNPMGDYAFTFSTGEQVDTMQVSGHVLDASNLEPIKGILVGLYRVSDSSANMLPDSIFRTKELERVSRTDSRGHFIIKGIAPGNYRVYALQDQDQDFRYSQKSEMLAFTDRVITPSFMPDVRHDTIWHDSIHYDSIIPVKYTHFLPDDIVLAAFQVAGKDRSMLKRERPQLEKFTLFFTGPDSTLPTFEGLNFDAADAFVLEANPTLDTLTYWIRDSLIYNLDTLNMVVHFNATDTLGHLQPTTDTLSLASKVSYEKTQKRKADAWEEYAKNYRKEYKNEHKEELKGKKSKDIDAEIEVPPMPEMFLEAKFSKQTMDPDNNLDILFNEPIDTLYESMFHFSEVIDSTKHERPFVIQRIVGSPMAYRFFAEWKPESKYELVIDTGAIVNIYGKRLEGVKKTLSIKSLETYSTLFVTLQNADTCAVVQLLNSSDKVVKEMKAANNRADFYFINPGTYYMRLFYDHDGDGMWTTGNYDLQQQAEEVYYYPGSLDLRAKWEINQTWNPTAQPIPRQKPAKITKQKPDKEKSTRSKNEERERNKQKQK